MTLALSSLRELAMLKKCRASLEFNTENSSVVITFHRPFPCSDFKTHQERFGSAQAAEEWACDQIAFYEGLARQRKVDEAEEKRRAMEIEVALLKEKKLAQLQLRLNLQSEQEDIMTQALLNSKKRLARLALHYNATFPRGTTFGYDDRVWWTIITGA